MNHLGSGHVLMNNRRRGREHVTEDLTTDRQRETVRHIDMHYGTFAANRQQTAGPEIFFRGNAASGNVFGLVGC